MAITVASIIGWNLRRTIFSSSVLPLQADSLIERAIPWVVVAWMVALVVRGAYTTRHFGAGPDEFRAVLVASFATGALVSMACYLLQLDLSRGFTLLTFLLGTGLLLVERYAMRHVVHRMRAGGRLLHRVVAVGGPSGVSEVVDALSREQRIGYSIVGACIPSGVAVEPERFSVPILGGVEEVRRLCDENCADTVLVARGGYATAKEL